MHLEKLKLYSLLSVALLISSGPAIAANIPAITKEFPTTNSTHVGLLTTIPSLFVIIGILTGNRLELWIGKKKTILMGLGLVFLSGIFPALKHDIFSLLFLSRCIFGLGIGLFNRLIIQMISDLYQHDPDQRARVIGMESSFEGLGGICLTLLVGQLLKISWHTSFLVYAIALPIFLAFFFFIPDDKKQLEKRTTTQKITVSDSLDDRNAYRLVIGFGMLLFVIVTIFINYNIQITPLILEKNIGNATNGSNMIAFIGLGAFIAGFAFGKMFQLLKDYTMPISLLLMGVFMYLTTISESILLTTFCSMVIGFAFRSIMPYLLHTFTQQTAKIARLGTTIVLVSYNIGSTLSPYEGAVFSQLLHVNTVQSLIFANSIFILFISIIGLVIVFIDRKRKNGQIIQKEEN
ncbi:MFS transporter [Priestia endophytica]|uniref:MFS transporter n=1 Tax=Priestia endophytica TaxID=135735 RepID=UPI00203A4A50|nr:MFS transporter [Priestia endophytica]MCM3537880.1 MFS transporter [Priestia endophytica]